MNSWELKIKKKNKMKDRQSKRNNKFIPKTPLEWAVNLKMNNPEAFDISKPCKDALEKSDYSLVEKLDNHDYSEVKEKEEKQPNKAKSFRDRMKQICSKVSEYIETDAERKYVKRKIKENIGKEPGE